MNLELNSCEPSSNPSLKEPEKCLISFVFCGFDVEMKLMKDTSPARCLLLIVVSLAVLKMYILGLAIMWKCLVLRKCKKTG